MTDRSADFLEAADQDDGLSPGVRVRIALDVLDHVRADDRLASRTASSRLRIDNLRVHEGGAVELHAVGDDVGLPELVWEILAARPLPSPPPPLGEVSWGLPESLVDLVDRALADRKSVEPGWPDRLRETCEGYVDTPEDVERAFGSFLHDRQAEKERIEKERIEKERIEKERIEKERIEKAAAERERVEKEKAAARIEKERLEKVRLEHERAEKEQEALRLEREKEEGARRLARGLPRPPPKLEPSRPQPTKQPSSRPPPPWPLLAKPTPLASFPRAPTVAAAPTPVEAATKTDLIPPPRTASPARPTPPASKPTQAGTPTPHVAGKSDSTFEPLEHLSSDSLPTTATLPSGRYRQVPVSGMLVRSDPPDAMPEGAEPEPPAPGTSSLGTVVLAGIVVGLLGIALFWMVTSSGANTPPKTAPSTPPAVTTTGPPVAAPAATALSAPPVRVAPPPPPSEQAASTSIPSASPSVSPPPAPTWKPPKSKPPKPPPTDKPFRPTEL